MSEAARNGAAIRTTTVPTNAWPANISDLTRHPRISTGSWLDKARTPKTCRLCTRVEQDVRPARACGCTCRLGRRFRALVLATRCGRSKFTNLVWGTPNNAYKGRVITPVVDHESQLG